MDRQQQYSALLAVDFSVLNSDKAIEQLGLLTDLAFDLGNKDGIQKAIDIGEQLGNRELTSIQNTILFYFRANAWAGLRCLRDEPHKQAVLWEHPEIERELFFLRSAVRSPGFAEVPGVRRCQIRTNLGNLLDHIGRFVEAIEQWEHALAIDPSFGMAVGNRGFALPYYARNLYDSGHAVCFLQEAQTALETALKLPLERGAHDGFRRSLEDINARLREAGVTERAHEKEFSLGDTPEEIEYRLWCLKNRLFLNSLNDLGALSVAARDLLLPPSMVTKIDEGPHLVGFFNQLKQEFVSARHQYYEGVTSDGIHFSDKDVLLFNTLDYPTYSRAVENVKASFRIVYSLFDKIAYFLNDYMRLGINERSVYFKTFWYAEQRKQNGLRAEFEKRLNWPWRGLFWLSKDLFEERPEFQDLVDPDARRLYTVRQHLEHKYLKLHQFGIPAKPKQHTGVADPFQDELAFSIDRRDLEGKTLRVLKLARAALIYLSLGMHGEEMRRAKERGEGKVLPMYLPTFDDDWKS